MCSNGVRHLEPRGGVSSSPNLSLREMSWYETNKKLGVYEVE